MTAAPAIACLSRELIGDVVTVAYLANASSAPSLMDGWLPLAVQLISVLATVYVIARRPLRWQLRCLPAAVVIGVVTAAVVRQGFLTLGLSSDPAPWQLWVWVGVTGMATATVVFGWPHATWWYRNLTVFAASVCLLSTGLTVNGWIGYFPTVATAWDQVTGAPLPGQTDMATIMAMRRDHRVPSSGAVVGVATGSEASGFDHRDEWVYLPPAWFSAETPLPTVMMIAGEFNTPADWVRAGNAVNALNAFAATHDGYAPVTVFVDPSGSFVNDTECVDGPRGNAASHLTQDVVPFISDTFGTLEGPAFWGVAGFSSGGTCALDLAVTHPDQFGSFVDIAGDLGPNAGTKEQTVDRLFGGDAEAWSAFDPTSVMTRHGPYRDVAGLFVVPVEQAGQMQNGTGSGATQLAAAQSLCALGRSNQIDCAVITIPGRHDWPFGAVSFAATLPWLARHVHTPKA